MSGPDQPGDLSYLAGRLHEGLNAVKAALTRLDEQVDETRTTTAAMEQRLRQLKEEMETLQTSVGSLELRHVEAQQTALKLAQEVAVTSKTLSDTAEDEKEKKKLLRIKAMATDLIKLLLAAGGAIGIDRITS